MNMKVIKEEIEVEPQSEEHGYQRSTLIFREEDEGEQTGNDVAKYIAGEPRPERNVQTFCLEKPDVGRVLTEYSRHEKPNVQTSEGVHRGDNGESLQEDSKDALKDGDMIEIQSAKGDYQTYTCIIKEEPSDDGHICDNVPAPCSLRQSGEISLERNTRQETGTSQDSAESLPSQSGPGLASGSSQSMSGNAFKMKNVSRSEPTSQEKSADRLPAGENLSRENVSGKESSSSESESSMDGCESSQKSIQVDSSPGFAVDEREVVPSASCHDKGTGSINHGKGVSSNNSTSNELQKSKHVAIGSQLYERAGTLPGFSCSQCDKVFSADSYLQKHINKCHSSKGPSECSICGKVCPKNSTLSSNSSAHTGGEPCRCSICGKQFCTRNQLSKHRRRIHPDRKPYQCTICGKCYTDRSALNSHTLRIHSGEKPYLCVVCGKRYWSRADILSHERIHTDEKPYQCTICNKNIAYKSSLLRHLGIHRRKGHYES